MFSRTSTGLSSEYLFFGVDIVVYCEGAQIDGENSTLDEAFWTKLFSENGRSCKCKSSGSKSELMILANKIISENATNVIVAMDRDYDDLTGSILSHPKILYTYGYSWESDAMLDFRFDNAIMLFSTIAETEQLEREFFGFRNRQSTRLRKAVALDVKYIGHHDKLFDRQKPQSIIASNDNMEPYIRFDTLLNKAKNLGKFQTTSIPPERYRQICGVTSFFGKAVSRLFYRWFEFRTSNMRGNRRVYYAAFMSIIISSLNFTDLSVPRNRYYSDMMAKF